MVDRFRTAPTIEGNFKKKGWAPAISIHQNQANLVINTDYGYYNNAPAVAKPWKTKYRGELFLYVPRHTKQVNIEIPKETVDIGIGLVGVAFLHKIVRITNEIVWKKEFSHHKEIGNLPYPETFLWYLPIIYKYKKPIEILIGGKWLSDKFESEPWSESRILADLDNNTLPPEERELHRVSLFNFVRMR